MHSSASTTTAPTPSSSSSGIVRHALRERIPMGLERIGRAVVAEAGTMTGRWRLWIKGRAREWGRKAGHIMRRSGGGGPPRTQGEVSTERGSTRMLSTGDDDGGGTDERKGGYGSGCGARGGAGSVYGREMGERKHRCCERDGWRAGMPRAHHIARGSYTAATEIALLYRAECIGQLRRAGPVDKCDYEALARCKFPGGEELVPR